MIIPLPETIRARIPAPPALADWAMDHCLDPDEVLQAWGKRCGERTLVRRLAMATGGRWGPAVSAA